MYESGNDRYIQWIQKGLYEHVGSAYAPYYNLYAAAQHLFRMGYHFISEIPDREIDYALGRFHF